MKPATIRITLMATCLLVISSIGMIQTAMANSKFNKCPQDTTFWHDCFGLIKFPDGSRYEGSWKFNKFDGRGTYIFPNADKYVGGFKGGKRSGQGTYSFASGNRYVGSSKDGDFNGQGTYSFADGGKYVGNFKDGKANGQGTFDYAQGNKYVGGWKNAKWDGQGTYTFRYGTKYVGAFKEGKFDGEMTVNYANGDKFKGLYISDKRTGQGTYVWKNGTSYVGQWTEGLPTTNGILTSPSGNTIDGATFYTEAAHDKHGYMFVPDRLTYSGGNYRLQQNPNDPKQQSTPYQNKEISESHVADVLPIPPPMPQVAGGKGDIRGGEPIEQGNGLQLPQVAPQQPLENSKKRTSDRIEGELEVLANEVTQPKQPPHQLVTSDNNLRKVALVIGNSGYQHATPLENPHNDAEAMASLLKGIGFEVVSGEDLDKRATEQKISEFVDKAAHADVSLFFYAGHGIQVAGENYIVPVDAAVEKPSAIDFELVNVSMVTNYMGGDKSIGIALFDACRDNPFTRSLSRSLGNRSNQVNQGLAELRSGGGGLLVGFATAPGDVAADGLGTKNSPFTTALLKHLGSKGLEVELLMKRVRADVYDQTKGKQQPWVNSALRTDVYLAGK